MALRLVGSVIGVAACLAAALPTCTWAVPFGAGVAIEITGDAGSNDFFVVRSADPVGINSATLTLHPINTTTPSASAALSRFSTVPGSSDGGTGSAAADLSTGSAVGVLNLGTLGVYSSATANGSVDSFAGFTNTLTPNADGFQHFDISVTGRATFPSELGILFRVDDTFLLGAVGEPMAGGGCPIETASTTCAYSFDVQVYSGVPYTVTMVMQDLVGGGNTLDASHTLTLQASGVGFTSASGASLIASSVPEPSTAALLVTGIAGLGFSLRRRAR